jgi:tetratricopeptide (TPR) repeat protein/tRNA A-37 threonylcarbamoyl transferase component Bud32
MPRHDADRNLLFGINALQNDFITRDALVEAMAAWAVAKHRPIGEILVERGALDPLDRAALEAMIARRLARHDDDPARSLAALGSASGLVAGLRRVLTDPDILASIALVPHDPHATRAPDPSDEPSASASGRYRKVRDHARGGLGIVYVALDGELKREVALKEIKPEYADNPVSQSRFLQEAEITGGLEHPGIVPVYGLGSYDDGRPFYAMRFIKGDSLKEAISSFHDPAAPLKEPGVRALELQKLLRRFLDVCNAIAYAHSKGVLHRDLKPDNVMVGRYGETLVVDWGLAKTFGRGVPDPERTLPSTKLLTSSISDLAETLPGSVVGTPAYMSPEQAGGRLDLLGPASDVYSLGATLYTLLTGRVPFAGKDAVEVLRQVERGEVVRPRGVSPRLDPALEAITLKAMAFLPSDRYDSPRALADDVERWLADEPASAYREPASVRLGRWARKHRTVVTATASTVLVAALLIGVFAWSAVERARRADLAGLATLARAEFLEAEANRGTDPAHWSEAIAEARRAEAQLDSGGGSTPARSRARLVLARLEAGLLVAERDRRMKDALDEARLQGANVREGKYDAAARVAATVAAFRDYGIDLLGWPPEKSAELVRSSRLAADLVAALDETGPRVDKALASRLAEVARLADADARGVDIRERITRRDFEGLRRLVADEGSRKALGARCRTIFGTLATLDPTASLATLEAIQGENRGDFWLTHDLATAYLICKPPRLEPAIRSYHAALSLRPTCAGAFVNLGNALDSNAEYDAAIAAYREAIRLRPGDATAFVNLGAAFHVKKDYEASIAASREAIRLQPNLLMAHLNLAAALTSQGLTQEAAAVYREASRLQDDDLDSRGRLGDEFLTLGDFAKAVDAYREAIRLGSQDAAMRTNLGIALAELGQLDGAISEYREVIRREPNHQAAHTNLGIALASKGDLGAAIGSFREAIRLQPDDPEVWSNLGTALRSRGTTDEAIAAYREAIRLRPDLAMAHCNLGLILADIGQFAEGLESLERGHAVGSKKEGWAYPSGDWVRLVQRLVLLDARLPAFLNGEALPLGAGEWVELASVCSKKGMHAASARCYEKAFAAEPGLLDDLEAGHRYNAACASALAGTRPGADNPPLDEPAKAAHRSVALARLRADLAARIKALDGDTLARAALGATLDHWKADGDLAGLRDSDGLAKLSEIEREAFRRLWGEVDAFRVQAGVP